MTYTKQLHIIQVHAIYGRILKPLNVTAVQVGLHYVLVYSFRIFSSFFNTFL